MVVLFYGWKYVPSNDGNADNKLMNDYKFKTSKGLRYDPYTNRFILLKYDACRNK